MHARFVLIAAAMLTSVNAFAAEPSKPAPPTSAQPQHGSPQVVLASAAQVASPAPADAQPQAVPTPPKKRVGRVTTCRCGDQPPQPDSGE
jgi:hypothetical protein